MIGRLQLGLDRCKARLASIDELHDPIHLSQSPETPLVTHEELLSLDVILSLCSAPFFETLPQSEDVRGDLGSHSLLSPQACNGDNGGEYPAHFCRASSDGRGGVGEEGTVVGGEDVDGQVGVGGGELLEEFGGVGVVDAVPESKGSGSDDLFYVRGSRKPGRAGLAGEKRETGPTYLVGRVERPAATSGSRCARRAPSELMVYTLYSSAQHHAVNAWTHPWDSRERDALQPRFPHDLSSSISSHRAISPHQYSQLHAQRWP